MNKRIRKKKTMQALREENARLKGFIDFNLSHPRDFIPLTYHDPIKLRIRKEVFVPHCIVTDPYIQYQCLEESKREVIREFAREILPYADIKIKRETPTRFIIEADLIVYSEKYSEKGGPTDETGEGNC